MTKKLLIRPLQLLFLVVVRFCSSLKEKASFCVGLGQCLQSRKYGIDALCVLSVCLRTIGQTDVSVHMEFDTKYRLIIAMVVAICLLHPHTTGWAKK